MLNSLKAFVLTCVNAHGIFFSSCFSNYVMLLLQLEHPVKTYNFLKFKVKGVSPNNNINTKSRISIQITSQR